MSSSTPPREDATPASDEPGRAAGKVAVIMPVRDGMPYLPAAVESILRQTGVDLSVVVVDDGSRDGTAAYLRTVSDRRVRVIHRPPEGTGTAENTGIAAVSAEFVARADADDIALPGRLAAQARFLRSHPDVGALGGQTYCFASNPERRGFRSHLPLAHDEIVRALARGEDALALPTVMFRSGVLRALGGHRVSGFGESLDLLLRAAELTRLANLAWPVVLYRVHPAGTSIVKWRHIQAIRRWSIACRSLRAARREEPTLAHYLDTERIGRGRRAGERLDCLALAEYRTAVCRLLDGQRWSGCGHLALAAACSPGRLLRRLQRELRYVMAGRPGVGEGPRV